MSIEYPTLAVTVAGLAAILVSAIYSISRYAASSIQRENYGSTIAQKSSLCVFSLVGLGSSIAFVLHAPVTEDDEIRGCLHLASWALIVGHSALVILSRTPCLIYELALGTSFSCTCLGIVLLTQVLFQTQYHVEHSTTITTLCIVQLVAVFLVGLMGLLFPRRPSSFTEEDKLVDGQNMTSALSKYSFAWAGPLLDAATEKGALELDDLPRPDRGARSIELARSWIEAKRTYRLWINIFLAHKWSFVLQWIMTAAQGFGNVAPQFMLFQILRSLEERDAGRLNSNAPWIWAIALGLSQAAAGWNNEWLFWISYSKLAIPVRAELSSLIFRKSMRRKDVRGDLVTKKRVMSGVAGSTAKPIPVIEPGVKASNKKNVEKDEGKEKEVKKASQSTINLIGVDAKRISDFLIHNNYFLGSISKLAVSFWFLIEIIGWKALGAGLLSMLIMMPINTQFSKRYSATQSKLMEIRDEKTADLSEVLRGARQVKFSAFEERWQAHLNSIRSRELEILWSLFHCQTAMHFCWTSSPVFLSTIALAAYSMNNQLTPSVAFTAIGVFSTLQVTFAVIPELITELINASVSVKRVQEYLDAPEVDVSDEETSPGIIFESATISFPSDRPIGTGDQRFTLRNLDLAFPEKELSVISGNTGSGKSLLLAAILREADIICGSVKAPRATSIEDRRDGKANQSNWIIPSAIAFVAQIPWIENATIKANVLFGLPFNRGRYEKTIDSCALRQDIKVLPDGEDTEIGPNGISLSGGQKSRLSFARALYSRAGILVLDDIFSAVDTHVGRHLFEKGLTGDLAVGRTRIIATHHVALCKTKATYLVELGGGTARYAGIFSELQGTEPLIKIVSQGETSTCTEQEKDTKAADCKDGKLDGAPTQLAEDAGVKRSAKKFVEEESKEKGKVNSRVYGDYLKSSGGWWFWSFAVITFLSQQALSLGRTWWLRLWTDANNKDMISSLMSNKTNVQYPINGFLIQSSQHDEKLGYWLGGYIGICLASSFIGTFALFFMFCGSLKASRILFARMLYTVLRAPLRWYDTVPLGRILNRFTADFNIVDSKLAHDVYAGIGALLKLAGIMIAGMFVSPFVLVLALVLAVICVVIGKKYLVGARETKRLEAITRSPIFAQFDSTLSGLTTIRAFGKTDHYVQLMSTLIDNETTTTWYLWLFNRWFSWRMSMLSAFFSAVVACLIVVAPGIDAALAGFALHFALEYNSAITWTIRIYTNVEMDMNAAERIIEYAELPTESQSGNSPPASWPSVGRIEVSNLSVAYAPDVPAVLRELTFSIEANQRVGIVGRTGAGKSSLTLALFRFLEAQTGGIHIDGIDISTIKLKDLRSRLSIIPQDPVLFSGTIRSNLDPFEERSDEELMNALRTLHLVPSGGEGGTLAACSSSPSLESISIDGPNQNPIASLESPISSSGLNLSQGQRQLLCLARSLVTRSKIMVMDEATSAVDMATDALIQRSIREEFRESTLLVVAHRLSTIVDFDRILVFDEGELREDGTPRELFDMGGLFKSMVVGSGQRAELEDAILGRV